MAHFKYIEKNYLGVGLFVCWLASGVLYFFTNLLFVGPASSAIYMGISIENKKLKFLNNILVY